MNDDERLGAGQTCFIISPIGSKLEPPGSAGRTRYEESAFMWENVFEPACRIFGLMPIRADKISESGEIPEQIFTYLRDAEVVIADVSHANPNVMYELGLRHTRPGITLQIGEYKLLPFDVTTIRTIQFNRTEAGLISARTDLVAALRTALNGGGIPLRVTTIWGDSPKPPKARVEADAEVSKSADDEWDEIEPGSMDILADGERAIHNITGVMKDTSAQIEGVGAIMSEHTASLATSDAKQGGFAGRLLVARRLNDALTPPAETLENNANEYYDDTRALDEMVSYVLRRLQDHDDSSDDRAALLGLLASFLKLTDSADEASVGTAKFREAIRGLRGFSKDLRPSLQVLDRATSRFLEGLAIMSGWRDKLSEHI